MVCCVLCRVVCVLCVVRVCAHVWNFPGIRGSFTGCRSFLPEFQVEIKNAGPVIIFAAMVPHVCDDRFPSRAPFSSSFRVSNLSKVLLAQLVLGLCSKHHCFVSLLPFLCITKRATRPLSARLITLICSPIAWTVSYTCRHRVQDRWIAVYRLRALATSSCEFLQQTQLNVGTAKYYQAMAVAPRRCFEISAGRTWASTSPWTPHGHHLWLRCSLA